jgi:hypothetical protein
VLNGSGQHIRYGYYKKYDYSRRGKTRKARDAANQPVPLTRSQSNGNGNANGTGNGAMPSTSPVAPGLEPTPEP